MRSFCSPGAQHPHASSAVVRPASCTNVQRPACSRMVLAQYMGDRRERRRDLVWDNVDDDSEAWRQPPAATPEEPTQDSMQQPAHTPEAATASMPSDNPAAAANAGPYQGFAHTPRPNNDGWGSSAQSSWSADGSLDDGGWGEQAAPSEWGAGAYEPRPRGWQAQSSSAHPGWSSGRPGGNMGARGSSATSSQSWDQGVQGPSEYGQGAWQAEQDSTNGFQNRGEGSYGQPHARGSPGMQGDPEWEFFADNGRQGNMGADREASGRGSIPSQPSDVTLLSRTEMEAVLPVIPTGRQASYYQPRNLSERVVQLMGSLAASVLLSKSAALAAPALLYPLWSPWIRAGLKNVELYSNQLKVVGLWRAQVLEVEVLASNTFRPGGWSATSRGSPVAANAVVRLLMGDPWEGGARVQLEFPYQPKSELLEVGESVEALVLARDSAFYAFKVIREVYAPGLGLWLAEYPFVDRTAFLDVSLQVERARQPNEYAWSPDADAPAAYTVVDVDVSASTDAMQGSNEQGFAMGGDGNAWGAWGPNEPQGGPTAANNGYAQGEVVQDSGYENGYVNGAAGDATLQNPGYENGSGVFRERQSSSSMGAEAVQPSPGYVNGQAYGGQDDWSAASAWNGVGVGGRGGSVAPGGGQGGATVPGDDWDGGWQQWDNSRDSGRAAEQGMRQPAGSGIA